MTKIAGWTELDDRAVAYARALAMDAVQKVGNGHPGTAMALAPVAYNLFQRHLVHDPSDPQWLGRDRFILSCGHSSMTLYTQLFFSGYGLEMEDIQSFRTWGSLTPGHPEYGHTAGVEMTTGPLGAGVATSVGFAMAARYERGLLDPEAPAGTSLFDHSIWVICSDGDLQEGVSGEASSLAGTQELGNLNIIYDDNRISIEGDTHVSFTEDVAARYRAYGWHVQDVPALSDGNVDLESLDKAMIAAKAEKTKPSLIRMHSIIAWPAPKLRGTGKSHGSALGDEEIAATKKELGLNPDEKFAMPDDVFAHVRAVKARGAAKRKEWDSRFEQWKKAHPDRASLLKRLVARELPAGWEATLPTFEAGKDVATRTASGHVINAIAKSLPEFWGGSSDLADSNMTTIEGGMVCTDDEETYQTLRMLRSHGMVRELSNQDYKDSWIEGNPGCNPEFIFAYAAYNMRNNEIGGILGRKQLPNLDENVKLRNFNNERFLRKIDQDKYFTDFKLEGASNYAFNLIMKEKDNVHLAKLMKAMRENGIEFRRGSAGGGNQLRQPYLKNMLPENYHLNFPNTEHIHFYGFYLGNFPSMSLDEIDFITKSLNEA